MELIINSPKYGQFTVLYDEDDHERISKYKWSVLKTKHNQFYTTAYINQKNTKMHNYVMGVTGIDHMDGNKLNNQKANLREATSKQNARNRGKMPHNKSGFKCVSWNNSLRLYKVEVSTGGEHYFGGWFRNKYLAAIKANEMLIKHHGEFASLNILTENDILLSKEVIQKRIKSTCKSGFRGVRYITRNKKFAAFYEAPRQKLKRFGLYKTAIEAAKAFNNYIITNDLPRELLNIIPND